MGIRSSIQSRIGEAAVLAFAAWAFAPQDALQLQPIDIALVVGFVILSLGIHEAAHGWVALKCGDTTARDMGRLTLNPIAHIDPFMTVILPAVLALMNAPIFGGAKPVPVNYYRLRHPLRDMALVAIAGPFSNFLLAIVFAVAAKLCFRHGGYSENSAVVQVLLWSSGANVGLAAFNLLPIPPLDGSRVMTWVLPSGLRQGYQTLERFGIMLVFLLMFLPPVKHAVVEMMGGFYWVVEKVTAAI